MMSDMIYRKSENNLLMSTLHNEIDLRRHNIAVQYSPNTSMTRDPSIAQILRMELTVNEETTCPAGSGDPGEQ